MEAIASHHPIRDDTGDVLEARATPLTRMIIELSHPGGDHLVHDQITGSTIAALFCWKPQHCVC